MATAPNKVDWSSSEANRVKDMSSAGAVIASGRLKDRPLESISAAEADDSILLDENLELIDRHHLLSLSVGRAAALNLDKGEGRVPIPRSAFSLNVADWFANNLASVGAKLNQRVEQRETHFELLGHTFSAVFNRGEILLRSASATQEPFMAAIRYGEQAVEKNRKVMDDTDDEPDEDEG